MKFNHSQWPALANLAGLCAHKGNGTVTAFVNKAMCSPFIAVQDPLFEHYLRMMGCYIEYFYPRDENAYAIFHGLSHNPRSSMMYSPLAKLDTCAMSWDGISATIEMVCSFYHMQPYAVYYKSPGMLYNMFQNDTDLDYYIKHHAWPTLLRYLEKENFATELRAMHAKPCELQPGDSEPSIDIEFHPHKLALMKENYLFSGSESQGIITLVQEVMGINEKA